MQFDLNLNPDVVYLIEKDKEIIKLMLLLNSIYLFLNKMI